MANILVRLKNAVVKFAKAPATVIEKVLSILSPIGQAAVAAGLIPVAPVLSIPMALSAVFTWLDKDSKRKDLMSKVLRILSWTSQGITAVLAWPIAIPAAIIAWGTSIQTFVDNLGDFLDDGKFNKSFSSK